MGRIYLFDVDGTLTPAKEKIESRFSKVFLKWMQDKEVYIVSGGSFPRIINQLGRKIVSNSAGIFACMGNAFYQQLEQINPSGFDEWQIIYENKFSAPRGLYQRLDEFIEESEYSTKTGKHYEERTGMVNFSIVGRNATMKQRKEYAEYDSLNNEREAIVEKLKSEYSSLDFAIGGAVSIDIFNIGADKSQVIERYFSDALDSNEIIFVGDRIPFPGNDCSLAMTLRQHNNGRAVEVNTWQDTVKLLKTEPFA